MKEKNISMDSKAMESVNFIPSDFQYKHGHNSGDSVTMAHHAEKYASHKYNGPFANEPLLWPIVQCLFITYCYHCL